MSEPTPLSAEDRHRLESLHPMWSHQSGVRGHEPGEGCDVFPCLTNRALATIDAQATEIAALRAVSEQQQQRAQLAEARCPKCEGRGFIRTMVDGERDSEPCSFCRMSGLAGKEAQGD